MTTFQNLAAVQNCWLKKNVGLFSGACIWNVRLISSCYRSVCLKYPQASYKIMTEK
jgi:hypothetical protein